MSADHRNPKAGASSASISLLRRATLSLLVLAPLGGLTACGFRLRGAVDLPFTAIAITGNPSPPMRADLQTAILTGTDVKVAINPRDADLILEITNELAGREVLAFNANGQISAYRLNIRVGFRAFDTAGNEIVPEAEIFITRDLDFSVSTVLANEAQIQGFLGLMRRDLAIQILRRVAASAKAPKTKAF
jgi:LPS-assembly lipoprotein